MLELLVIVLIVVVVVGIFVITGSNRRNRRSLQKTQIALTKGSEAVQDIEREGRRTTFRNFAVLIVFFGVMGLIFWITGGGK